MKQTLKIQGLTIVEKLAQGGQGEVYHVRRGKEDYALKLYFERTATPAQRAIIEQLVASGVPAREYKHRFAWPFELVELPDGSRFGYLMPLIDTTHFISLSDIKGGKVPHPGYGVATEACRQLAECFREIHIEGVCYQDISENNFLFSPENGDVMICDNDNIAIDKQGDGNVLGTPQFMAPEIILGKARPSTVTDQHSLAILLFMLLCGGHPFHGKREYDIKIYDLHAIRYLYGEAPVFIFDPKDRSNRPPDIAGYRHVARHWKVLPTQIKDLFVKAFTTGPKDPSLRVTDMELIYALTQMLGQRHVCKCGAENFWDPRRKDQQVCWNRSCSVAYPPKLYLKGRDTTALLVKPGSRITTMHLGERSSATLIGEMEVHPDDASLVLLRNKTGATWDAELGNQKLSIPSGRAIPLHPGIRIRIPNGEIAVYA